jgi:hypothetical protein
MACYGDSFTFFYLLPKQYATLLELVDHCQWVVVSGLTGEAEDWQISCYMYGPYKEMS